MDNADREYPKQSEWGWDWVISASGLPGAYECGYFLRTYTDCRRDLREKILRLKNDPAFSEYQLQWAIRWTPVNAANGQIPSPRSAIMAMSKQCQALSMQNWRDRTIVNSRYANVSISSSLQ